MDFGLAIELDPSVFRMRLHESDAGALWFHVFPHNFASFITKTLHAALETTREQVRAGTMVSCRSPLRAEINTMVFHKY